MAALKKGNLYRVEESGISDSIGFFLGHLEKKTGGICFLEGGADVAKKYPQLKGRAEIYPITTTPAENSIDPREISALDGKITEACRAGNKIMLLQLTSICAEYENRVDALGKYLNFFTEAVTNSNCILIVVFNPLNVKDALVRLVRSRIPQELKKELKLPPPPKVTKAPPPPPPPEMDALAREIGRLKEMGQVIRVSKVRELIREADFLDTNLRARLREEISGINEKELVSERLIKFIETIVSAIEIAKAARKRIQEVEKLIEKSNANKGFKETLIKMLRGLKEDISVLGLKDAKVRINVWDIRPSSVGVITSKADGIAGMLRAEENRLAHAARKKVKGEEVAERYERLRKQLRESKISPADRKIFVDYVAEFDSKARSGPNLARSIEKLMLVEKVLVDVIYTAALAAKWRAYNAEAVKGFFQKRKEKREKRDALHLYELKLREAKEYLGLLLKMP